MACQLGSILHYHRYAGGGAVTVPEALIRSLCVWIVRQLVIVITGSFRPSSPYRERQF